MARAAVSKAEAENAIRSLCGQWADERGFNQIDYGGLNFHPSYHEFKGWAESKGYGGYWNFRSRMGANYDAEMWFDEEFKLMWRR
jgi:hypothetical protein